MSYKKIVCFGNSLEHYFSHRSNFETLQYKQRVLKDLEEDLGLLLHGMHEAENHQEKTQAELDLAESNRYQIQKVRSIITY